MFALKLPGRRERQVSPRLDVAGVPSLCVAGELTSIRAIFRFKSYCINFCRTQPAEDNGE